MNMKIEFFNNKYKRDTTNVCKMKNTNKKKEREEKKMKGKWFWIYTQNSKTKLPLNFINIATDHHLCGGLRSRFQVVLMNFHVQSLKCLISHLKSVFFVHLLLLIYCDSMILMKYIDWFFFVFFSFCF